MLRHFTYSAIADDCLTLLAHDDQENGIFQAMLSNRDFIHLGNTGDLDEQATRLLENNREDNVRTGYEPEECAQKEVFLLGALCRKETNRIPQLSEDNDEQALQQDAAIFRAYYAKGMNWDEGMSRDLLSKRGVTAEEAIQKTADFLRIVFKRAIVRTHTFKPGYEDIQTWLGRFFRKQQVFESTLPRYAKAIVQPGEDLVQKYLKNPDFFDPDDRVIQMATALREGKPVDSGTLEKALNEAPTSLYGQALQNCCRAALVFGRNLRSIKT